MTFDYDWVMEHGHTPALAHDGWMVAIVYAEKGPSSTWDRPAIRARFRTGAEQAQWRAAIARFAA